MSLSDKGIIWGYGIQSTNVSTAVPASAGLRVRREGSLPDIKSGMVPIEAPIYRGKYNEYGADRKPGYYAPTFEHPGLLRPGLLKLILDAVMDPTADTDGWDYAVKSSTDDAPDTTAHLTIIRANEFMSTVDKRLVGAVAKQIKLSSSTSQQKVHLDTSWIGYDYDDLQDESGGTFTVPTENWLTHAGLGFEIGTGNSFATPEWDLTIGFGVVGILDNANNPAEFIMGPLTAEGTVKIPYTDGDVYGDFEAGTTNNLIWTWGAHAASGYLKITVPVMYDEPGEDQGEERIRVEIPFKLYEASGQAFEIALEV